MQICRSSESFLCTHCISHQEFTLIVPKVKIVEFANSVDPEVTHDEPHYLELLCFVFYPLMDGWLAILLPFNSTAVISG